MKCPHCNVELPNNAFFCSFCGSPINSASAETTVLSPQQQPANTNWQNFSPSAEDPIKKKKRHTGAIVACIVLIPTLLAVIAASIFFFVLPQFQSKNEAEDAYLQPFKNFCSALNAQALSYDETSMFGTASSSFDALYYKMVAQVEPDSYFSNDNVYYSYFDNQYGNDWKLSYKIITQAKLSKSQLTLIQKEWEDYILICKDNVQTLVDYGGFEEKDLKHLSKLISEMDSKKVTAGYQITYNLFNKKYSKDPGTKIIGYLLKIGNDWTYTEDNFSYFSEN